MMEVSNDDQKPKHVNKLKAIIWVFVIAASFLSVAAAYKDVAESDLNASNTTLRKKIETYKKFKAHYEDKDFHLDSDPMRRVEHINGKSTTSSFDIYRITYGVIADNIKEYGKSRKQIVQNPTNSRMSGTPTCQIGLYLEDYTRSGMYPDITCLEEAEHSYPISLIINTLSEEELKEVAIIYEFNDGDLDIQFSIDKGRNKGLIEKLYNKLHRADEKNDEKRQEAKMEPIIPTRNQRLTAAYIDEDKDGEADFVLIPYCINGSFFDDDPGNNSIQVALKYKLVTRKNLKGITPIKRNALEKRMGLVMWDKPIEILTSFSEQPGPDIAFYDLGKVVNSRIIDSEPDGKFDKYEFLN
jgi:hypothetical protein